VPEIADVPEMVFIMVDGCGDPNTSAEYAAAVNVLYGLSYGIKMSKMGGVLPEGYFDFVVPPLEGLWSVDDESFVGGGAQIADKSKLRWTSMIRQPEFVTDAVFEGAKEILSKKKPDLDLSAARLENYTEGLCVQVMHIGPYDDEPETVAAMDRYAREAGYGMDISEARRHHEIYLSDPRKTAPEKLKTIIRHQLRRV
jgi:hypothetical protein